ncbi:MAG: hypothetical protein GC149_06455 [Gammaproteobacteria bacterium]|nr:hypothetical protein [Gammaproteobacteria bacterium]
MIILATADNKIASRWRASLDNPENVVVVGSVTALKVQLRQSPRSTVILHGSLPGISVVSDIKELLKTDPDANLFVLADVPDEQQGIELIRAGVLGYANTHIRQDILKEAFKVIELGEIWVSKRLMQWLVNHCGPSDQYLTALANYAGLGDLTPAEQKVIEHLLNGNTNKQIALQLQITERTVKAHLTSIFRKTGVKDRLHLALLVNHYETADGT